MNASTQEFIDQCIYRIEKSTPKIVECLSRLTEEQIWQQPNEASNSIGNILLHLCGNIRQYIMSGIGDQPDMRERDKEFSAKSGYSKEELQQKLTDTLQKAVDIIKSIDEGNLLRLKSIQGFTMSGIGAIVHVTEHYSHHTGQIIFWTKQLTGKDLRFYNSVELNRKSQN
jgi:uncharacterized damage-inducible protein DinB